MMVDIRTDSTLLQALSAAARTQIPAGELRKQRVSFIMGALGDDSRLTPAQVTEILAVHETGRTPVCRVDG